MVEFMRPERLWWLVMIPLLIGLYVFLLWRRRRRARPHAITNLERVLPKQQAWKRHAAVGAAVLALGALNVARIIGIFARLVVRDGKPKYESMLPRLWRYLDSCLADPTMAGMKAWFDRHVPAEARA